jgi:hypothetical protein
MTNAKYCARCAVKPALKGERYCRPCRKLVLQELRASGKLTFAPRLADVTGQK